MESALGVDLGAVRIHTDTQAGTLSRQLSARAFTTGSDVFFGSGEYQPGTASGRHLLAHELAHTVQQGGSQPIRRALSLDKTKWSDAKSISATSSSAVGVFFLKDKSGKTIVVKGAHGTARLEMADEIMQAAGGEAVPQRMIPLASKEGKQLLSVMMKLAKKVAPDPVTKENAVLDKFNTQFTGGKFDAVQVMETSQNLGDLQSLAETGDMAQLLPMMAKNGFFRQLGRVHAADVFMGNEDRLARGSGGVMHVSLKNIFVNTKTGQNVGLDMELNAHSFEQVTGDLPDLDPVTGKPTASLTAANAPSLKGSESLDFVNYSINGSGSKKGYQPKKGAAKSGPMGMRGAEQIVPSQAEALDPSKAGALFDRMVNGIADEARVKGNAANVAALATADWTGPKAQFLAGVSQGTKNLTAKSAELASSAQAKIAQTGAQPFFDPMVFRVRAMYAKLKSTGQNDEKELIDTLVDYVDFIRTGGTDEAFLQDLQSSYLLLHGAGLGGPKAPVMPGLPGLPKASVKPSLPAVPNRKRRTATASK